MVKAGASAALLIRIAGQASPVSIGIADQVVGRSRKKSGNAAARAGKISEAGSLREEIFIPYGFSGRERSEQENPQKPDKS